MHICKFFYLILVHSNMFQMYNLVYQLQYSSIKFCSYNFVSNEVPNNNDIKCVANIVLNKAPNSNGTTHVANDVCLTTMGGQQFSMAAIEPSCRKPTYQRQEMMTQQQERFVRTKINFALGRNGGYMPSSLGGRSISVGKQ